MIAGGYVNSLSSIYTNNNNPYNITEVVDLLKSNSTPSFGQLPLVYNHNAVGAMLGNVPIICGGFNGLSAVDFCISFENSEWSQNHLLNDKRAFSAGVKINSTTLWILGGWNGSNDLDSTEFIIQGQSKGVPGPKLPYTLTCACTVKLSEEEIFVIGGVTLPIYASKKVWIYYPQKGFIRHPGPSLNKGRFTHSCSTMTDGEKTLIIVAGGIGADNTVLDSVEIYDPNENKWHSGNIKALE